MGLLDTSVEPQTFTCPRCTAQVTETYYGPCVDCRAELRAKFHGEGREVEVAEYVPKMNVTPNAVALKDD
jgi:NMD protein affecting ribosome stability and mRNA decay